ncbi:kinesin light chain-like [Lingula anatina]|uniref:Kinesin light chain-like n=1 Tax=Lingula anatina TaxID=7574 RepID=A0A1S3J834_LINAN|nr:kinesin light chain-like [Lingula anatina]|eukprot:XP_013406473.1 kinesin light chain-like [Lingula anatina]
MIYAGHIDGAIDALRRALSVSEKTLGEYHEQTAITIQTLARAISAQRNHAEALSTYQRALRIREQVLGESQSTAITYTLHCMGQEMIALVNADGAVDVLRRALAMKEKILGEYHEQTAATIHEITRAISTQGDHPAALGTYQSALRIQEQVLGECVSTANTIHCIGQELTMMNKKGEAIIAFVRAIVMGMKTTGIIPHSCSSDKT